MTQFEKRNCWLQGIWAVVKGYLVSLLGPTKVGRGMQPWSKVKIEPFLGTSSPMWLSTSRKRVHIRNEEYFFGRHLHKFCSFLFWVSSRVPHRKYSMAVLPNDSINSDLGTKPPSRTSDIIHYRRSHSLPPRRGPVHQSIIQPPFYHILEFVTMMTSKWALGLQQPLNPHYNYNKNIENNYYTLIYYHYFVL